MAEWLINWVVPLVKRYWLTLTLFIFLVSTITYSLDAANWVRGDQGLVSLFMGGLALGWLLSTSRFRTWIVAAYAVLLSLLISINSAGQVTALPRPIIGTPFWTLVDRLNLRAFTFYLRVQGWVETLSSEKSLEDTGLFEILLGFILMLCAVWLMYWTIRKRRMLVALLPIGFLFVVNVHLARQSLGYLMLFLLTAILLVARTNFNWQNEDWQRRKVDYPDQLGLEWGTSAFAAALVIVLLARAAPLVGTREGWQAISEWVEKARVKTERTSERLFGGVNPPPPPIDAKPLVYVNTPDLGEIGRPISQGSDTIMWVRLSDPPPIPPQIGQNIPVSTVPIRTHYYRSAIFGRYTGRGWESQPAGDAVAQAEDPPETAPAGRYILQQDFTIEAISGIALFSVNEPAKTSPEVSLYPVGSDGTLLLQGGAKRYQVYSFAPNVTANTLNDAGTDYPPEIAAAYLQLPETLPERVGALAARVSASGSTPYQKAILIQEYLRGNYTYDLGVKMAPAQRDVVDYFLFDGKAGFCSHYATAMTVMLRTAGVPARVVTGYAMGDWTQGEGAFRVPASNAHAWVEVYFPGFGWAEFEPTAGREAIVYREEAPVMDSAAVAQASSPENVPPSPVMVALTFVGALLLLALPFLLVRLFSVLRLGPYVRADVLYRQVRRALGWAGLAASPSLTPDEYLVYCRAPLSNYEQLGKALRQVTDVYRAYVYSPHPPDARTVRRASITWGQSSREWMWLVVRSAWERARKRN